MRSSIVVVGLILALECSASACTSCFGAAGDQATHGLNMAILTLLGVMCLVIGSALACISVIVFRAWEKEREEAQSPGEVETLLSGAEQEPC